MVRFTIYDSSEERFIKINVRKDAQYTVKYYGQDFEYRFLNETDKANFIHHIQIVDENDNDIGPLNTMLLFDNPKAQLVNFYPKVSNNFGEDNHDEYAYDYDGEGYDYNESDDSDDE